MAGSSVNERFAATTSDASSGHRKAARAARLSARLTGGLADSASGCEKLGNIGVGEQGSHRISEIDFTSFCTSRALISFSWTALSAFSSASWRFFAFTVNSISKETDR